MRVAEQALARLCPFFLLVSSVFAQQTQMVPPSTVTSTHSSTHPLAAKQQPSELKPKPAQDSGTSALGSSTAVGGQSDQATAKAPTAWAFTLQPESIYVGEQYQLILELIGDNCTSSKDPFGDLAPIKSDSPVDIVVGTTSSIAGAPCKLIVPVTVPNIANPGKFSLVLTSKTGSKTLGIAPITVRGQRAKPSGPIPDGMKPTVDLMWKVLPRSTVADSYGGRIADHYFAIEVTIGNDSGHDLQIAALGFLPQMTTTNKSGSDSLDTRVPLPNDSYPGVRGTIEREQFVGTRAMVVNFAKAMSTILVGVGGFYVSDANSLFTPAVSIFSGPFEKGLELVYPDLTTNHLINLDNRTLRDGVVVPNNTPTRINAFISRETIQCSYPKRWYRLYTVPRSGYSCPNTPKGDPADPRLSYSRDFNPDEIRKRLGKLVLIGRPIDYLNRIRVVATNDTIDAKVPPLVLQRSIEVQKATASPISLVGLHMQSAVVTSPSAKIKILVPTVSTDGTLVTFTVDATGADAGQYTLELSTPYGMTPINLTVIASEKQNTNSVAPAAAKSAETAQPAPTSTTQPKQ